VPTTGLKSYSESAGATGLQTSTLIEGKPGVTKWSNGYFTTPNNWFFLPAAGIREAGVFYDGSTQSVGKRGYFWSSTPSSITDNAWLLGFDNYTTSDGTVKNVHVSNNNRRYGLTLWNAQ
jgi:hypothetical protein